MKAIVLAVALSLCGSLALAQPIQYQSSDNINNTPVSAATPLPVTVANQTGTSASQVQGSSASAATDDGSNPVKIGCIGAVSGFTVTITNGARGNIACANHGNIGIAGESTSGMNGVAVGSAPRGDGAQALQIEPGGLTFSEITTATSTTVKASAGIVHRVTVNTCVASATVKIYNASSATGTPITITCPSTVGNPFYIDYGAYFGTAIFVVTSGATDVTVLYR